jgi:hypothetical protein
LTIFNAGVRKVAQFLPVPVKINNRNFWRKREIHALANLPLADQEPDALVGSAYVRNLFGGRSTMWIHRNTPKVPADAA